MVTRRKAQGADQKKKNTTSFSFFPWLSPSRSTRCIALIVALEFIHLGEKMDHKRPRTSTHSRGHHDAERKNQRKTKTANRNNSRPNKKPKKNHQTQFNTTLFSCAGCLFDNWSRFFQQTKSFFCLEAETTLGCEWKS